MEKEDFLLVLHQKQKEERSALRDSDAIEKHRADNAFLTAARAQFYTWDDDKNPGTRLEGFINFYRGGGEPILAAYMESVGVVFPDNSTINQNIPLRLGPNVMYKSDLPGSQFLIRISWPPNGIKDHWRMDCDITLTFSDGFTVSKFLGYRQMDVNHPEYVINL